METARYTLHVLWSSPAHTCCGRLSGNHVGVWKASASVCRRPRVVGRPWISVVQRYHSCSYSELERGLARRPPNGALAYMIISALDSYIRRRRSDCIGLDISTWLQGLLHDHAVLSTLRLSVTIKGDLNMYAVDFNVWFLIISYKFNLSVLINQSTNTYIA